MASNEKGFSYTTGSYEYKTSAFPSAITLLGLYLRLKIQTCLLSGLLSMFKSLSIKFVKNNHFTIIFEDWIGLDCR